MGDPTDPTDVLDVELRAALEQLVTDARIHLHTGPGNVRDGLRQAVLLRNRTHAVLEVLIADGVRQCRINGATWVRIGALLGVARQSAHDRYAHLDRPTTRDETQ